MENFPYNSLFLSITLCKMTIQYPLPLVTQNFGERDGFQVLFSVFQKHHGKSTKVVCRNTKKNLKFVPFTKILG